MSGYGIKGQAGDAASFVESLGAYSRQHKAKHWAGTLEEFLRDILPASPRKLARTSHEYLWDMLCWHGQQQPGRHQRPKRPLPARALRHRRPARARRRLLQGRGCRLRRRPTPAAAARPAVGRQVDDGDSPEARDRRVQPHRRRRGLRAGRLAAARVAAQHRADHAAGAVPRAVRSRAARRAEPLGTRPARARVRGRFSAHAGRADLPLGGLTGRRRHLRAARSVHCRHRGPRGFGGPVEGRAFRRRGRPARVVVVGRRVCREPRRARDDRDPEGQARVPLSPAHAHPGKERQGFALSAHPSGRDDPGAHQPGGIQQVPAGKGKRGAARPHGDRARALHAVVRRGRAHLPQAGVFGAGVPRRAPRSARAARRRGLRGDDAACQIRARRSRPRQEGADLRGRECRGLYLDGSRASAARGAGRGFDGRQPALRHQRRVERDHAQRHAQPYEHGSPARSQGRDRERCAHGRQAQEGLDRPPRGRAQGVLQPLGQGGRAPRALRLVRGRGAGAARQVPGRGGGCPRPARGQGPDHRRVASARRAVPALGRGQDQGLGLRQADVPAGNRPQGHGRLQGRREVHAQEPCAA